MASQKNIESLAEIKEKVEKAQAIFMVDYAGLTHIQLEEFRHELTNAKAEIAVLKNTLVNIALADKKIEASDRLKGPHAVIFAYEDPISAAKALVAFNKKYQLPNLYFDLLFFPLLLSLFLLLLFLIFLFVILLDVNFHLSSH
jgi:large subunit ribosomal protein L10